MESAQGLLPFSKTWPKALYHLQVLDRYSRFVIADLLPKSSPSVDSFEPIKQKKRPTVPRGLWALGGAKYKARLCARKFFLIEACSEAHKKIVLETCVSSIILKCTTART